MRLTAAAAMRRAVAGTRPHCPAAGAAPGRKGFAATFASFARASPASRHIAGIATTMNRQGMSRVKAVQTASCTASTPARQKSQAAKCRRSASILARARPPMNIITKPNRSRVMKLLTKFSSRGGVLSGAFQPGGTGTGG